MVAGAVVSGTDVLEEVLDPVVLVDGSVVDEVDATVVSVDDVEAVVATAVVVVGCAVVVVGAWVVVVTGLDVVVEEGTLLSPSSAIVVVSAGAILPRPSRASSTMPGRSIDVGDSGVVEGTVLPPIGAAGTRSDSTLTALRARGAATAAAVTVDSDRASQNRPRPADSPGRCRYMDESELEG